MIENGHFRELQSIIDMLPVTNGSAENLQNAENSLTTPISQRKKRQTLVFSATLSLSSDFRKKLKRVSSKPNQSGMDGLNSIEALSERAGIRPNVAVINLTNTSVLANNLEESFIEYAPFHLISNILYFFCLLLLLLLLLNNGEREKKFKTANTSKM